MSNYVFVPPLDGSGLTLDALRTTVIADARARYRRARGDTVTYAAALTGGDGRTRDQLARLDVSVTETPALDRDPQARAWAQWLFLRLRARRAIEQPEPDGPYVLRLARYLTQNYQGLQELDAWSDRAREWQGAVVQPIEGVELHAQGIDGTDLDVFTEHGDRVSQATLVALSPEHPDLERWVRSPQARQELQQARTDPSRVVATGLFAWVPSVEKLLPVAIAHSVHDRVGATALLVIPKADRRDASLHDGYAGPTTTSYNYRGKRSKPRAAARFVTPDRPLSAADGAGAGGGVPVPLLHCEDCGTVAAPLDRLPIEHDDAGDVHCPDCGGVARPDGGTLDHQLLHALSWLVPIAPPGTPPEPSGDTITLIASAPTASAVHDMRTVGKALQELGTLGDGEPFERAFVHEPVDAGDAAPDLDALLTDAGADALRLAILHEAAASRRLTWSDATLTFARRFLQRLTEFATPRLADRGHLDLNASRRRDTPALLRLDRWVDVATIKITENLETLDLHRATRNLQALLDRVEDFETRPGAEADADGDAVAIALLVLVKLASPLAPATAQDLWERAGQAGTVADAPWPAANAERAQATPA
ncbi:MAG TPA: class I tRNA ligase family protein [Baekduia sp.]